MMSLNIIEKYLYHDNLTFLLVVWQGPVAASCTYMLQGIFGDSFMVYFF